MGNRTDFVICYHRAFDCAACKKKDMQIVIDRLTADLAASQADCAGLREIVKGVFAFVRGQDEDCFGRDRHLGYPYRDEFLSRLEGELEALAASEALGYEGEVKDGFR